jgi:hypothetical protein
MQQSKVSHFVGRKPTSSTDLVVATKEAQKKMSSSEYYDLSQLLCFTDKATHLIISPMTRPGKISIPSKHA